MGVLHRLLRHRALSIALDLRGDRVALQASINTARWEKLSSAQPKDIDLPPFEA
jgi:hypothetical protein